MSHAELDLLSNIISHGSMAEVRKMGIDPSFFRTDTGIDVFRWIWDYYHHPAHRGAVPNKDQLKRKFPSFPYSPSRIPIKALINEVRNDYLCDDIEETTADMQAMIQEGEDPQTVLQCFIPRLRELNLQSDDDEGVFLSSAAANLKQEYLTKVSSGGITGSPYPWAPLNKATGGMQPEQFIVIYARPKNMKCVHEDELVMSSDGSMVKIKDLPDQPIVASHAAQDGEFRWANAQKVHSGIKECVRVTTETGYEIQTSKDHYYMVPPEPGLFEGTFKRAHELREGDWVAVVDRVSLTLEDCTQEDLDKAWLLGVLMGDACVRNETPVLTNVDLPVLGEVYTVLDKYFDCELSAARSDGISYGIRNDVRSGPNKVSEWLRSLGYHGKLPIEKETPQWIFRKSMPAVRAYLAGLLDTGGTVSVGSEESKPVVSWYTSSRQLSRDIKHLLMRLGIHASRYHVPTKDSWQISVANSEGITSLHAMLKHFLAHSTKSRNLKELSKRGTLRKKYKDSIPFSQGLLDLILSEKGDSPWPKMGDSYFDKSKLFRRSEAIPRSRLLRLASEWKSDALMKVATDFRKWERIKSVEPIGKHNCYDVCIKDGKDPNFVVSDFVVHNTFLAVYLAVHAYIKGGSRVFVFSKEMRKEDMIRRAAAFIAKVDYGDLKSANLTDDERDRFFEIMEEIEEMEEQTSIRGRRRAMYFASDKGRRKASTVEDVMSRAERFDPDLVIVDGMYLMRDGRSSNRTVDWKQISHISQDIKGMAQYLSCPVVATTQANRQGARTVSDDLDDVSFSDSLGQDADVLIRIFKGRNPYGDGASIALTFPGVREADLNPFLIHAKPGLDFSLLSERVDMKAFLEAKNMMEAEESNKNHALSTKKKSPVPRKRSAPKKTQGARNQKGKPLEPRRLKRVPEAAAKRKREEARKLPPFIRS